jgi:hypothetical protein
MTEQLPTQHVEVSFVRPPPAPHIARASGVSDVEVDGTVLRCVVRGSFQPFLEALRGYEVTSLKSTPEHGHSAPEMDTIEKG